MIKGSDPRDSMLNLWPLIFPQKAGGLLPDFKNGKSTQMPKVKWCSNVKPFCLYFEMCCPKRPKYFCLRYIRDFFENHNIKMVRKAFRRIGYCAGVCWTKKYKNSMDIKVTWKDPFIIFLGLKCHSKRTNLDFRTWTVSSLPTYPIWKFNWNTSSQEPKSQINKSITENGWKIKPSCRSPDSISVPKIHNHSIWNHYWQLFRWFNLIIVVVSLDWMNEW